MNILIWIILISVGLWVLSAVLVGVGLFFKKDLGDRAFSDGTVVRNYELPDWLWWSQNPEDNLTGDKRGWYWNIYMEGRPDWWKMWVWSAWRNPLNYWKRIKTGCDIREHRVVKICGDDYVRDDFENTGFQILLAVPTAMHSKWYHYKPALYWVRRWGSSNRGIVVQLGWKIKLSHNGATYVDPLDYFKGWTLEPQPFKDIS